MTLAVGLSAAGCGDVGEPTAIPSTESDPASDVQDPAETDDGGEPGTSETLSWVPFGPGDPDVPTPSWPAYNAFASGDCAALKSYTTGQDLGAFGRAMVAVCEAAVDGQPGQWDEAAALVGADPSVLANDCLAALVSDLIDRAIDWHERNPGQQPNVQFVQVAGQTECGAQSAALNGDDDSTDEPNDSTDEPDDSTDEPDDPADEPDDSADEPDVGVGSGLSLGGSG